MSIRKELICEIETYFEEMKEEGHSNISLISAVGSHLDIIENSVNEAKSSLEEIDSKEALETLTELSKDLY